MGNESKKYDATTIQVLEGTDAVRRRPAMYIGDTSSRGLHHLVYEVVDNSIDEALAGYCKTIIVIVHRDNSVSVIDDGRGIPVDKHKSENKPAVEVVLTTLHAGGKFDHCAYKVSGGLHGVGVSVVNALSEWLEVEVKREDKKWHQRYKRGKVASKLISIGNAKTTGTKITLRPIPKFLRKSNFPMMFLRSACANWHFLIKAYILSLSMSTTIKRVCFSLTAASSHLLST